MKNYIRKRSLLLMIIAMISCFALVFASCTNTMEASLGDEPEETEETESVDPVEPEEVEPKEEKDESGFAPYDSADEEVMIGDTKVGVIFEEVRKVRKGEQDVNWDIISVDMGEYCGVRGEGAAVCYAFADLNGDGTDELIMGDENGYPMCVYMEKNGTMHMPDLVYYRAPNAIRSDGIINTMQGNGIPDEEHKDGYYFKIDPSAADGITETEPGSDEPMQFNWKLFQ